MSATEPRRLARRLAAVLFAFGFASCSVEATGALVTLQLNGFVAPRLNVTVERNGVRIGTGGYTVTPIPDGATFGVQLPDAFDGTSVDIQVDLVDVNGTRIATGTRPVTVALHAIVRVTIALSVPGGNPDGGVDGGSDFARPLDAAPPDLSSTDGRPPDLLGADGPPGNGDGAMCVRTCQNNMATTCGNPSQIACPGGCDANGIGCVIPTCQAPFMITGNATLALDTSTAPNNLSGSCGGDLGHEAVFSLSLTQFTTVTISDAAGMSVPVLYTRQTCMGKDELASGGPCNQTPQATACSSTAQNPTQVLCGLPPGTYYTVLDSSGSGFLSTFDVKFIPVALNDCISAGMLPKPINSVTADTGTQGGGSHMMAKKGDPSCGVDYGVTAPEFVYYVPALNPPQGAHLKATVTNLSKAQGFIPLLYIEQACDPNSALCALGTQQNGFSPSIDIAVTLPGPYFIIVDGDQGTKGSFKLDVTWP